MSDVMQDFSLDEKLASDCFCIAESKISVLLLLNNANYPWFILVPKSSVTEIHDLPATMRSKIRQQVDLLAEFVEAQFKPDKLNIATIGNIVSQLHIHIVGRNITDIEWPGVVWGGASKSYRQEKIAEIFRLAKENLSAYFLVNEYKK